GPHEDRERVRGVHRVDLDGHDREATQAGHAGRTAPRRLRPVPGRQIGPRGGDREPVRAATSAAAVVLGALLVLSVRAEGPAATPLRVRRGPRQREWKRTFTPFRNDADTRWPAAAGVYEPLLFHNRATGSYVPWLATEYKWAADNRTLRFTVRPGVLWSDGTAFGARDVAFTFDLMRRFPALDRQGVWEFLADVKALDATTVEFVLKRAFTPGLVAIGQQPIVAEHAWKAVADPVGFDDP